MKVPILIFVLLSTKLCESRVASNEADVNTGQLQVESKRPTLACTLRTLNVGDPYPSVIVKWRDQVHALTWDSNRQEVIHENYKLPSVSHSYPSSGGLSGGGTVSAPRDPFGDATVLPDSYSSEDVVKFFREDCKRPY